MPGFRIIVGKSKLHKGFSKCNENKLILRSIESENLLIEQLTLNKFLNDKVFFENEDYILVTEGVILNSIELTRKYDSPDFTSALIKSYKNNGETFFNEFRGSFSGLIFDKKLDTWLIYTDHIGDKQVFYFQDNEQWVMGSEMGWIMDYCRQAGIKLSLNEEAAYMLLTYGFFIENHTLASEVKKLTAGHYLHICKGKAQEIQYHRFNNVPDYSTSLDEWIEGIDLHFRNAVKRQFDKDIEYGYKHITTLSGGLDSRMTVWVAHAMGYTKQLNTTFSQSDYLDETIAKKIATDLKHEWLFKALDHGNFLLNLDEITDITGGGGTYAGLAHGKSMYDTVDFGSYGIAHTGQIGDSIIGTFYIKPISGIPYKIGDGAYSSMFISSLEGYKVKYAYNNQEIFNLYNRAFNGANQGLLVFQKQTESCSPFIDVDFLEYCYSIPVELRFKHKIYIDWILQKYPGAANYIWEKTKQKIKPVSDTATVNILGKKVPKGKVVKWFFGAIKRRLPLLNSDNKKSPVISKADMNPFDYWYHDNQCISHFFTNYFLSTIDHIPNDNISNLCKEMFNNGSAYDKIQVLTLLSAYKKLISK